MEFIYTRKFVILRDDLSSILGLKPKGHALLEIRENKGKMSINIDRSEKENFYKVYLVGVNDQDFIEKEIGRIFTDDRGKGNLEILFNPKNVGDDEYSIDKYSAIVLRKDKNVLLTGYIDEKNKFLSKYISQIDENSYSREVYQEEKVGPAEELPEPQVLEEVEEEIIKEIIEEVEEKVEEVGEIQEIEEVAKEELLRDEKAVEEIVENTEIENEEVPEETFQNVETKFEYGEDLDIEYIKQLSYKNQMSNYILNILRFFPYVKPFNANLEGYDWWRIEYDGADIHRGFLPYYNYLSNMYNVYPFMPNATTCQELIAKYNHYLFGLYRENNDIKYYMYGIPGTFTSLEHPYRGVTGFNTWFESADGIGYWVLYINSMTGKVIFPINPMTPYY